MKQKFILLFFGVITAAAAFAQAQSVISAAGDRSQNGKISLDWTLGEPAVETIQTNKRNFTQGFHQPLIIKKIQPMVPGIPNLPDYLFTIAPNPVISELTVNIDKKITCKVQVQLTDFYGRTIVLFAPSANKQFKFSLQGQPSGTYYLIIRNQNGALLKTFSVIK